MDALLERHDLFPDIQPFEHGMLDLDGHHTMYWERSGNPAGIPAVFLHGGPGAGASAAHRRFFDPRHYQIVVFDQRGAGRSRPTADLRDNTTPHLIGDIEALRRHLGIERWLVFGGSWGAALAVAYGIAHPDRCLGFVLRGVFLGRRQELDWFLSGLRAVFPEASRAFHEFLPEAERDAPVAGYHRRLIDPDPKVHGPAARAWATYENACSKLIPPGGYGGRGSDPRTEIKTSPGPVDGWAPLSLARIECHYFINEMFLDDDALLGNIDGLGALPVIIVQGRYDMICPIVTADALARALPHAGYVVIPDAGHSALEPGIRSALVAATEDLKGRLPLGRGGEKP